MSQLIVIFQYLIKLQAKYVRNPVVSYKIKIVYSNKSVGGQRILNKDVDMQVIPLTHWGFAPSIERRTQVVVARTNYTVIRNSVRKDN